MEQKTVQKRPIINQTMHLYMAVSLVTLQNSPTGNMKVTSTGTNYCSPIFVVQLILRVVDSCLSCFTPLALPVLVVHMVSAVQPAGRFLWPSGTSGGCWCAEYSRSHPSFSESFCKTQHVHVHVSWNWWIAGFDPDSKCVCSWCYPGEFLSPTQHWIFWTSM